MSNYPLWDQLNQLKESKWVDLTHTFDPDIPRFSDFEKVKYLRYSQFKNMVLCSTMEYRHTIWYAYRCPYSFR